MIVFSVINQQPSDDIFFFFKENFLVSMDPHHLDIETSDVSLTNALSKALK